MPSNAASISASACFNWASCFINRPLRQASAASACAQKRAASKTSTRVSSVAFTERKRTNGSEYPWPHPLYDINDDR
jgi:hypothetical protein